MSGKEIVLYFISDPKSLTDHYGALATEASIVKDAILVKNVDDLIQRVLRKCLTFDAPKIKALIIASHGNSAVFGIGENTIYKEDPALMRLAMIRGFFTSNAVVVINACECGQNQELMLKLARILGVTVIAYTGDIDVYKLPIGLGQGVVPNGNKVVCTAKECRETNGWEELRQVFQRGPGEPPGWAREI